MCQVETKNNKVDVGYLILLISCVLITIGCYLFNMFGISSYKENVVTLQKQIDDLNNQIVQQQELNAEKDSVVVYETTGVDGRWVQTNTLVIERFCKEAFTWYSYDEYTDARNTMINDYGIAEDSYFMNTFFPDMTPTELYDGTVENIIDDNGINCMFEDMQVYLTEINEDTYSYITFVDFSSRSLNDYESKSTACLMCDVTETGEISNISAYVAY